MASSNLEKIKICPICKRTFQNRKKWESRGLWEQIIYCSDKCRISKKNTLKDS